MNYLRYCITIEPRKAELLLAFLNELPFASFEETKEGLNAYIPDSEDIAALETELDSLQKQFFFYVRTRKNRAA